MLTARMIAVAALPIAAAAGLAGEQARQAPSRFDGIRFSLELPAAWSRTLHLGCARETPPGGDECWEVAHFAGPGGGWLRVVADGPAEDAAAQAFATAAVSSSGALLAAPPLEPVRWISYSARRDGRTWLLVAGSSGDEALDPATVSELLAGFRAR
ncbi:MAG TPA: hypothetical protein VLU43_10700 [Anaeromyxobacteraceae bacterium]|nr:hypothetical protein [Anaeromyxobacteraceae bacterium]